MVYEDLMAQELAAGYLPREAKSNIESALTTQIGNAYKDGEITREKAMELLMAHTGKGETKLKEWDFELEHGFSWSARVRNYRLGKISEENLVEAVMDIEGANEDEAAEYIQFLDLEMDNQDTEITSADASSYFEYAEPFGIGLDTYLDFKENTSGMSSDYDENGKTVTSKKTKIMNLIDSMDLTNAQKDALYYASGYKESTIDEAPWRKRG